MGSNALLSSSPCQKMVEADYREKFPDHSSLSHQVALQKKSYVSMRQMRDSALCQFPLQVILVPFEPKLKAWGSDQYRLSHRKSVEKFLAKWRNRDVYQMDTSQIRFLEGLPLKPSS